MRLAYIISAYKYPEQLIRLILRLNTDTTSFFIHVDKKTDNEVYRLYWHDRCPRTSFQRQMFRSRRMGMCLRQSPSYGLATQELRQKELDHGDPDYEVVIMVRAMRPEVTL
ncbi:MAG: hypothetical protein ACM3SR_12560 [Ignavibacteriales bacterium]